MDDAILEVLEWINSMILSLSTDGSKLTGTMSNFMPQLYSYTELVMTNVVLPDPLAPTKAITSPASIDNEMFVKIFLYHISSKLKFIFSASPSLF